MFIILPVELTNHEYVSSLETNWMENKNIFMLTC